MTTKLAVMQQIIAAWHKQDVEGVLAHVTDDIVWHNSSGYAPAVRGKAAMRAALEVLALRHSAPHLTKSILDAAEAATRAGDKASVGRFLAGLAGPARAASCLAGA